LLECVCGRRIRSDGTFADGRHRKLHPDPCEARGAQARYGDGGARSRAGGGDAPRRRGRRPSRGHAQRCGAAGDPRPCPGRNGRCAS
jgi:hypothetical protein